MTLIEQLRSELNNDMAGVWAGVQGMRQWFVPSIFASRPADRQSFDRSVKTTISILTALEQEMSLEGMCPGHGPGHWMRDYVNACRLLSDSSTLMGRTETEILAGFAGGVLHDIGNAVVDRYHDGKVPVRHAEVAGLMLDRLFTQNDFGLSVNEQLAIQWAVMAHTHYLNPQEVKWSGQTVIIEPYQDLDNDGQPLYGVWFPRMIDRLDCSGAATFPARHFLTLFKEHQDFSATEGFYDVAFHDHIQLLLRTPEEIKAAGGKQSMLEHLRMFALSQTNDSAYGKHDYGRMLSLRDEKREELHKFIDAVAYFGNKMRVHTDDELAAERDCLKAYLTFIEPSMAAKGAIDQLDTLLAQEDASVQSTWLYGFTAVAMNAYQRWGAIVAHELTMLDVPLTLPFVGDTLDFLMFTPGQDTTSRLVV